MTKSLTNLTPSGVERIRAEAFEEAAKVASRFEAEEDEAAYDKRQNGRDDNFNCARASAAAHIAQRIRALALPSEPPSPRDVEGRAREIVEGETLLVVASVRLGAHLSEDWHSCRHLWAVDGDGGDLGGNRTEVVCRKCQCPGDYEEDFGRIVWPTT